MADPISMSTEEKRLVTVQPLTAAGNPATVDGSATFTVTSGDCTIQLLEPPDPLSVYVVSGTIIGTSMVEMHCDADLGSGVVPVVDTMAVNVTSPTAASLSVTVGPPELK